MNPIDKSKPTFVACNSVVIPRESAVIFATVDFRAMTSCLEMFSSFSSESFSCCRHFLALFSTSSSNSCFSWRDLTSSSALVILNWRSWIFAVALQEKVKKDGNQDRTWKTHKIYFYEWKSGLQTEKKLRLRQMSMKKLWPRQFP